MRFRKAKKGELGTILALYRSAVGGEFCTWDDEYPGEFEVNVDHAAGCLYVLTDGDAIAGALSVVPENELDDLDLWQTDSKAAREIARVVVAKEYRGRGLAYEMVQNLIPILQKQGCRTIRLLVACENPPAYKTYRRSGFAVRGEVEMYGHRFYACEQRI